MKIITRKFYADNLNIGIPEKPKIIIVITVIVYKDVKCGLIALSYSMEIHDHSCAVIFVSIRRSTKKGGKLQY